MGYEFTVDDEVPTSPQDVYDAWMSSERHTAMTGGEASIEPRVDGAFTAWDGYIEGRTLALEPARRIVQAWRTSDFRPDDPDSEIEVTLEPVAGGTRITLRHSKIPDGQTGYEQGWRDNYFDPMREYFAGRR